MEFALSADQLMMQDSIARTLERVCPLSRVREAAAQHAMACDVWQALGDLGVTRMLVPEERGGLGLTLLDAALASEMLGRFAAPVPFLGSAVAALSGGEGIAALAISEAVSGARDGAGVRVKNGTLSGTALFVLDAKAADFALVAARDGQIYRAPICERIALTAIDATRDVCELRFTGAPAEALSVKLTRLRDAAWILLAADTLGAAQKMLDMAVAYAKERRQFGRVIGSFQAVKHLCAEAAAELEPARALVWYAAHVFDARPEEASLAAAHAKAHLSEVGTRIARTATEVHGGMGITDLLGLHFWFKRIGLNRQLLGGPDRVRALAAAEQGLI